MRELLESHIAQACADRRTWVLYTNCETEQQERQSAEGLAKAQKRRHPEAAGCRSSQNQQAR